MAEAPQMMKILIMAGGKGTRLWPLSNSKKPKQFQKLTNAKKTMLQETVSRVLPIVKIKDIYVSVTKEHLPEAIKQLPAIKKENIIQEPVSRERASSIALSCAILAKRHPKETVVVLPADHLIKKKKELLSVISKAEKVLDRFPNHLITIGIIPRFPDTGLGYMQKGSPLKNARSKVFKVKQFIEKPDFQRAKKFIKTKNFFWNSAIYILKPETILELFKRYVPDTFQHISKIAQKIDKPGFQKALQENYPKTDIVSFEYSIVENCDKILFIPADLGWSDVGTWASLKDALVKQNHKNLVRARHLDIESSDILVYALPQKKICTIGLQGLVIVDTKNALLICDKSRSQQVKEIVKMFTKN